MMRQSTDQCIQIQPKRHHERDLQAQVTEERESVTDVAAQGHQPAGGQRHQSKQVRLLKIWNGERDGGQRQEQAPFPRHPQHQRWDQENQRRRPEPAPQRQGPVGIGGSSQDALNQFQRPQRVECQRYQENRQGQDENLPLLLPGQGGIQQQKPGKQQAALIFGSCQQQPYPCQPPLAGSQSVPQDAQPADHQPGDVTVENVVQALITDQHQRARAFEYPRREKGAGNVQENDNTVSCVVWEEIKQPVQGIDPFWVKVIPIISVVDVHVAFEIVQAGNPTRIQPYGNSRHCDAHSNRKYFTKT